MGSNRTSRYALFGGLTMGLAGVAIAWLGTARAGGISVTNPLQYAGTLSEQGVPVNGTRDLEVVIWNDATAAAATNKLCDTVAGTTSVVQGRFLVLLSNTCQTGFSTTPDTWAEVFVGGVSFGRQKVGAVPYSVISAAVNGLVTSTAILPAYNVNGSLGTGGGGASIYNDGTSAQALVINGNSSATSGGARAVSLNDNVGVSGNLAVGGGVTVGGTLAAHRFNITGTYVLSVADTADIACHQGDLALSGGFVCHDDYDQMALQSYPNISATAPLEPVGWHGLCMNHSNSSLQNPPKTLYVVCLARE
jgi:hypothetical protein